MISRSVEPSLYLTVLAVAIALAPVVVAAVLVYRRRVSGLSAAAVLVYWGLFIVVLEHANWVLPNSAGRTCERTLGSTTRCWPRMAWPPWHWLGSWLRR